MLVFAGESVDAVCLVARRSLGRSGHWQWKVGDYFQFVVEWNIWEVGSFGFHGCSRFMINCEGANKSGLSITINS